VQPNDRGELRPVPLLAVTSSLYGAARRAAEPVARADDPGPVAEECRVVLRLMLEGLRA
jgi:hypothetical protein